jgi:hypothetical protein
VEDLKEKHGVTVGLGVLLVGERKDSQTYVRMKKRAAEAAGISIQVTTLSAEATELEIIAAVDALVAAESIHGVLVQVRHHVLSGRVFISWGPGERSWQCILCSGVSVCDGCARDWIYE